MPTMTFYPTLDGYVEYRVGTATGYSRSDSDLLKTKGGGGQSTIQRAFADFDFSALPGGATITQLELFLTLNNQGQAAHLDEPGYPQDTGGTRTAIKEMPQLIADYTGDTNEIQSFEYSSEPVEGSFVLTITGYGSTEPILAGDDYTDIETKIRAIPGLENVIVTTDYDLTFFVEFVETGGADIDIMSDSDNTLTGSGGLPAVTISFAQVQAGTPGETDVIFDDIGTGDAYASYVDFGDVSSTLLGGDAVANANLNGNLPIGIMTDPENPGHASYNMWNDYFADFESVENGTEAFRPYIVATYTTTVSIRRRATMTCVA